MTENPADFVPIWMILSAAFGFIIGDACGDYRRHRHCLQQANEELRDLIGVTGHQAFEALEFQFNQLAADFDLRRAARGEYQVADVFAGFQHGADELWHVEAALD